MRFKDTRMGGAQLFMSTNIQWQSFQLTKADRAKIKKSATSMPGDDRLISRWKVDAGQYFGRKTQ